jgi:hypothetical protein
VGGPPTRPTLDYADILLILAHRRAPLVVGILAVVGVTAYLAFNFSSPGDLASPHAKIAGTSLRFDCNKCHGAETLSQSCLGCHTEIAGALNARKGYHAYLAVHQPGGCETCHSEHQGPDYPLVNAVSWGGKKEHFKHVHVAYRLTGKHARIECASCHDKAPPVVLPGFPKEKRSRTFLGLRQSCASCHKDPHAGGASPACDRCHDQEKFRPAPFFRHDKFPLTRGHARVSCEKCHPVPPSPAPGWKPFQESRGGHCQDCHKNPHRTSWGASCETCHAKDGRPWAEASRTFTVAQHARTGFSLAPPHARTACAKCHDPGVPFRRRYALDGSPRANKTCEVCHTGPHGDQFRPKHPLCGECHGPSAFKPATFTTRNHGVYPLTGRHARASCNACHRIPSKGRPRAYVGVSRACAACHRDAHWRQFEKNGATLCEDCHASTASWKKVIFDHNRQSAYRLDAAHARVACAKCHPPARAPGGAIVTLYKPLPHECWDCHELDPR